MARGVETVSILGAGVLLTVGLMVFADWRTNTSTSTEGMPISLEEQPLSEKAFAASVEAEKEPLPLASAQPPIAKMEATDPEQAPAALAPAIALEESPEPRVAAADQPIVLVPEAPEAPASDEESLPVDVSEPDSDESDADAEEKEGKVESETVSAAEPSRVQPDQELRLLEQAHASLSQLHRLLLRVDQSRANSQREADKLSKILDRLPEETQEAVRAWIKNGYERRVRRANPTDTLQDRAASSVSVSDAAIGNRDDTPGDLKALHKRIQLLRSQVRPGASTLKEPSTGTVRSQEIGPGVQASPL